MNNASIIARLALSSIKTNPVRSMLTVFSFSLGMALILLAVSIPSASKARAERERAMMPQVLEEDASRPNAYVLLVHLPSEFLGRTVVLDGMSAVGERPPMPPGLDQIPEPGTSAVSPELATLLKSAAGRWLRPRIPGEIAQIIQPEGLPSPDALLGYVGLDRADLVGPEVVVRYGPNPSSPPTPISLGVWIAVVLLLLSVIAPIASVLIAATRLSSRAREARLAAFRLQGATPTLLRLTATTESSVLAFGGTMIGIPLYLYGRRFLADLFPNPYRWLPGDLTSDPIWVAAAVLTVVVFAAAVSLTAMKRVIFTPLGLLKRSAPRRERPVGLWLIATGLILLILAPLFALLNAQSLAMVDVALALPLITVGVIMALPWLVRRVASKLARRVQHPALVIATHSLHSDPGTLGRAAAAVSVIVLFGATGQAMVLASAPNGETVALARAEREPSTVFVSAQGPKRHLADLMTNVRGVADVRERPTDLWGGVGLHNFAVETDGSARAKEMIRNALAFDARFLTVQSAGDLRRRYLGPWNSIKGIVEGIVAIAILVIWASTFVSAIDRTIDQRASMAALTALGTRTGLLRGALLAQVVLPLGLSLALGWILSVPITTTLFSAVQAELLLPLRFSVELILVLAALTLATAALTFPWVRGISRPAALRQE